MVQALLKKYGGVMSKKPRKKKNSNAMRARRLSSIFTHGLGVAQINHEKCHVVDLRKAEKYKNATRSIIAQFTDSPHKWSILLCCFCENNGEQYIKTEQINLASAYYQRDLLEFLRESHNELAESCNQPHLKGLGWIASTDDVDFDLEQAEVLFQRLGAWDE